MFYDKRNNVSLQQRTSPVYIAGSDAEVRKSIQFLLETENIPVTTFSEGQAILDFVLTTLPDCVVIEAVLQDITGVMLLKRLREQGLLVPIIILVETGDMSMAVDAIKAGAWDCFEKPIVQRVLLDSVQRAIRHNQRNNRSRESQE